MSAASDVPTLQILEDKSVLASGDQTKRDVYRLRYANTVASLAALRLEALPDSRLPKNGPGRIAYEGPFGDFFLSEFTVRAAGPPAAIKQASQSFAAGNSTAAAAIDGDPQTGWSISGGQGRAHTAVFTLAQPLAPTPTIDLELLFERYYAAGLGRFRVWATDNPAATAHDLPTEIETLLQTSDENRTPQDRARLLTYYLSIAPELAAERAAIDKLRERLAALPDHARHGRASD